LQNLSEKRLAEILDAQYQHGEITELEAGRMLEEFRSARAQRKASTYALYAAIAAVVSALLAGGSLVVSIIALRH
jgi:hypothetical protein